MADVDCWSFELEFEFEFGFEIRRTFAPAPVNNWLLLFSLFELFVNSKLWICWFSWWCWKVEFSLNEERFELKITNGLLMLGKLKAKEEGDNEYEAAEAGDTELWLMHCSIMPGSNWVESSNCCWLRFVPPLLLLLNRICQLLLFVAELFINVLTLVELFPLLQIDVAMFKLEFVLMGIGLLFYFCLKIN